MPAPTSYDYAIVRVVPRVERGERLNAGVVLYCRAKGFLEARVELDRARLAALAPGADAGLIDAHLQALRRFCQGGAAAGALGQLTQAERFHWLVAPRSAVLQTSKVHTGLCDDPVATLERLVQRLVRAAE